MVAPGRSERCRRTGAPSVELFRGLLAFAAWAEHTVHDWWAPLRVQLQNTHHGGLSDPVVTLFHDAKGVLHHHVGTALHVPWVLLALAMLVVCWRRLPAPYTLFAAAVLAVALSGSNLDSFERYAWSAFPLSLAAALLLAEAQVERLVLTLLGGRARRVRPAGLPQHLRAVTGIRSVWGARSLVGLSGRPGTDSAEPAAHVRFQNR